MPSHKSQNRFRFIGFNERIKQIHVDVSHQARRYSANPDSAETFFAVELAKQSELNYSQDFDNFIEEMCQLKLKTYPLLLHHKDRIVDALLKHLRVERSLCQQSLMELTIAICRDLHDDFQPWFWQFFDVIVAILAGDNSTAVLESCFSTISYLLKFSWRRMLEQTDLVLRRFEPLLSSQRKYVCRFAAEAMVFFIRKAPNFADIVVFCFNEVGEGRLQLGGLAELMVQCIIGFGRGLHGSAEQKFCALVELFHENRVDVSRYEELLKMVNERLIHHCDLPSASVVFNCLCKSSRLAPGCQIAVEPQKLALLDMMCDWLSFKNGALLTCERRLEFLQSFLLPLLRSGQNSKQALVTICSLVSVLLRSSDSRREYCSAVVGVTEVMSTFGPHCDHETLAILEKCADISRFQIPFSSFLSSYLASHLHEDPTSNDRMLLCLVRLFCSKRNFFGQSTAEDGRSGWAKRLSVTRPEALDTYLDGVLKRCATGPEAIGSPGTFNRLVGVCLLSDSLMVYNHLIKYGNQIAKHLLSCGLSKKNTLALGALLDTLPIGQKQKLTSHLSLDDIMVEQERSFWRDPYSLRLIDLCLEHTSEPLWLVSTLLQYMSENLLSPFHIVRVLSLRILRTLCAKVKFEGGVLLMNECLEAESIECTLVEYRNKLVVYKRMVQKFTSIECREDLVMFRLCVVYFLLGQLRVNFSLLWNPVLELLDTAFRAMSTWSWPILLALIQPGALQDEEERICEVDLDSDCLADFVEDYACPPSGYHDRPDALKFRNILWSFLERIYDFAEGKTSDLSPMLIRAVEQELDCYESRKFKMEDLTVGSAGEGETFVEVIEEEDEEDVEEASVEVAGKADFKLLIFMLKVFARFKNPSAVHDSAALKQCYFRLLLQADSGLQMAALHCLFNYFDEASLILSRTEIETLLDDRRFREQLVLITGKLQADQGNTSALMDVLLRLLYGRIQNKAGLQRKNQVFAFLSRSAPSHATFFLELTLSPVRKVLPRGVVGMDAMVGYDPTKSVPFYILNKAVADLMEMIRRMSHCLSEDNQRVMFEVTVTVAAVAQWICSSRAGLAHYAFLRGKKLKKRTDAFFALFFDRYPEHSFSGEHLEHLFQTTVWPALTEDCKGRQVSSGLYKLFEYWSRSERYWSLLDCRQSTQSDSTFAYQIRCLRDEGLALRTENHVLNVVANLFALADDWTSAEEPSTVLDKCPTFASAHSSAAGLKRPDALVFKHTDELVAYFLRKLSASRDEPNERDLDILCRLAAEARTSNDPLLVLLLNRVKSVRKNENAEVLLLKSVLHLLRFATNLKDHFQNVVSLFACIHRRSSKKLLTDAFSVVAVGDDDYVELQEIMHGLNSWDENAVEEPDYARRTSSHKAARKMLNRVPAHKLANCIRLFCCHCFDELKVHTDFSLRSNALETIEASLGCCKARLKAELASFLLNDLFLPKIRAALNDSQETVRNDAALLLRCCVGHFADRPALAGLGQLRSSDLELDFFENMRHIQPLRRARAFRRLCDNLENPSDSFQPIPSRILADYVLPFALPVLEDPKMLKVPALGSDVIRLVKCYAQGTPWWRYVSFLQSYLKRLQSEDNENHQVLVKVVVAILDGFHFTIGEEEDGIDGVSNRSASMLNTLAEVLLPDLKQALAGKKLDGKALQRESGKLKVVDDDQEMVRVPIALAVVKLLKKLPESFLNKELSGIVLRVCSMLKNRSLDVRNLARKTLMSMVQTLGAGCLVAVIRDLRSVLIRGFQRHVLCFTVHGLLEELKDSIGEGDLDSVLPDILEICHEELFGSLCEERKVEAIRNTVLEARTSKAIHTYCIIGEKLDGGSMPRVLAPLKEAIRCGAKFEAIKSVADCLKELATGLSKNQWIPVERKLGFVFESLNEGLPFLITQNLTEASVSDATDGSGGRDGVQADCYLLPPEPGRRGVAPLSSKRSNFNVLVSFALDLLLSILKRRKLPIDDKESWSLLDPFVLPLTNCLQTSYVEVVCRAVRGLIYCVRYPLPSIKDASASMVDNVFILFRKYIGMGDACHGEAFGVLMGCFKLITVIIDRVEWVRLNEQQVDTLLRYAEEDLADSRKQAAAFSLIKTIFAKRYVSNAVQPVVAKLMELSITSTVDHLRQNCRFALAKYLKYCCLKSEKKKKRLSEMIEFYLVQLSYDMESGRISALEMLAWFVRSLRAPRLSHFGCLMFLQLSLRLLNDESEKCKELSALVIKSLLNKVDGRTKKDCLVLAVDWLSGDVVYRQLGALCLGLFFETRIAEKDKNLRSMLATLIKGVRSVRSELDGKSSNRDLDHLLYFLLVSCCKALKRVPSEKRQVNLEKYKNPIFEILQWTLTYEHLWVRMAASQLLGLCLPFFGKPASVGDLAKCPLDDCDAKTAASFCNKLLDHIDKHMNSEALVEQAIKNLTFLSKFTDEYAAGRPSSFTKSDCEKEGENEVQLSLLWLSNRMVKLCRLELHANHNDCSIRRCNFFKWVAAVSLECHPDCLELLLPVVLPPFFRECEVGTNEAVKNLALEVCEILKTRTGLERFSELWTDCRSQFMAKRMARKQKRATEAVSNPAKVAKRKIRRHRSQVKSKKRRLVQTA